MKRVVARTFCNSSSVAISSREKNFLGTVLALRMFPRCFFYLLVTVLPCFQATFKCPSLFNFYPDVHDCSKFYRCIWGKGAAFNCPSGTLWSQDLLTCNHAKEVKCDKPSVSEEMKDFEAPDFSVDIKKSKGSHSPDDDGEDSNDEDNKAESSWSDSKEDPHKNRKHTKEDSYYTNYDTDYGDSGGYEYKAKKDNSKPTHQKMTNGQHKTAPESQEYHHVISHIPQPQHFVHHFQPTPYVLPAPQEYKSSVQLPQQYLSGPHQYQNVALPPHYQSAQVLQQYHAGPLHQQYHGELPPLSPPSGYILAPPNYVFQAPKSPSQEGEKSASMTLSGKAPLWYNRNYLYNKLVQVPQLGAHYYSPYVVNTDGTYDVVKLDVPSPEPEKLKLKPQAKPENKQKLEPQIEKPPTEEDPWKETDLFRAGYGYKLIYHK